MLVERSLLGESFPGMKSSSVFVDGASGGAQTSAERCRDMCGYQLW